MISVRFGTKVLIGAVVAGIAAMPGLAYAGNAGYSTGPADGEGYSGAGKLDREFRIAGTAPSWAADRPPVGDVDGDQVRRVHVALGMRNARGAERLATAVSSPDSPQYGQFLAKGQFAERFGPTQGTVAAVSSWLRSKGLTVSDVSKNQQLITAEGDVDELENAFRVKLSAYRLRDANGTRVTVAPNADIAVPARLAGSVTAVLGLSDSSLMRPHQQQLPVQPSAGGGRGCARYWGEQNNSAVPQKYAKGRQSNYLCGYNTRQTRGIYHLGRGNTGRGQTVGIVGAYNLRSIKSDTNRAALQYGSPILTPGQYRGVLPSRFEDESKCGAEAWHVEQAMDVQAVHTMAPAARITYYGARSCNDADIFGALNKAVEDNRVSIISNSWGAPDEADLPPAVHRHFGQIAVQAATQGQALLFSSGDAGDSSGLGKRQLLFPAASPWVTAAGGTTVAVGADDKQRFVTGWESAGNTLSDGRWRPQRDKDGPFAGGAGGGRSAYYDQPKYQRDRVPSSIARGKRAVPDVAALADAYTGMGIGYTSKNGYVTTAGGGTSLASPLLAGVIADAQQVKGKRFGFLNPALYKIGSGGVIADVTPAKAGVWTDRMVAFGGVTVPMAKGDYLIDADAKPQSLRSARGWDPVTGLGTPTRGFIERLAK